MPFSCALRRRVATGVSTARCKSQAVYASCRLLRQVHSVLRSHVLSHVQRTLMQCAVHGPFSF